MASKDKSAIAHTHLLEAYPELVGLTQQTGLISVSPSRKRNLPEQVVRIVIGQMLSGAAAETIYDRVLFETKRSALKGSWLLSEAALLSCGLSRRKARTILEFGQFYQNNKRIVDDWGSLQYEALSAQVNALWGLSQWSADMLAIFYFGHEDVFPETDGSIRRAIANIEAGYRMKRLFDPTLARPFSTYLALYLWRGLDIGYWHR